MVVSIAAIVFGTPIGRFAVAELRLRTLASASRLWTGEEDWRIVDARRNLERARGIAKTRRDFQAAFAESPLEKQALLQAAGVTPDRALIRWGNYDWTLVLSGRVFEIDDAGLSYRLKPNVRSIWLRNVNIGRDVKGYFLVPDTSEVRSAVARTDAAVVAGSEQTTNSWGCRGPEPDPDAPLRGIVLGDSYMQGFLIGQAESPPAVLERELTRRLKTRASILNTGCLGYSTEQYYFALSAFVDRFRPDFVLVAPFANDFGEGSAVSTRGEGDWADARRWYGLIARECRARSIVYLVAPVIDEPQVRLLRRDAYYPAPLTLATDLVGPHYLDPAEALIDADLRLSTAETVRTGRKPTRSPLYNVEVNDGHYSALGAEAWAIRVARRLELLLRERSVAGDRRFRGVGAVSSAPGRKKASPPGRRAELYKDDAR